MRVFALMLVSFLLGGAPLPAADLSGLELDGGLVLLGATDPDSAPSPIMPAFGVVLPPWRPVGRFVLESSLLLFGTTYEYSDLDERARPVDPANREFWVQGILGDARLRYDWRLGEKARLGADAGLAVLLRVPIPLSSEGAQDFGSAFGYLHGRLRFLYPETGLFAVFPFTERLDLKPSLRAAWPLYLLWDGERLPFAEGLLVSLTLGFVLHTKS
jgi:hypothetical protein